MFGGSIILETEYSFIEFSWEKILEYFKIFSQEDFALRSKLWPANFLLHRLSRFFLSRNKGQLRAAVTRPCRLSTPLCHTYSEPSGHELSPGGTQNIPYLFKNLSKSRLSDPFFGLFFGDFWGREPDLHSEFSDFQNLSVFSNFLAWNHIVCHRYR